MNIYITNEANKMRLLDVLSKEKRFNNNKFYSFRKLKKKLIFDYNNKTIEYVMNKYNVNINIAKIYLENLYFLKDLEDNKVKFLNALKKDLDENNLLIYNKEFRKYLENKDITVYNKSKLSKEEKRILEGLNIRIENNLNNNYEPSIYEAENIEEEVEYVVRSIKELLCKNVDINNIKIIASKEYNKSRSERLKFTYKEQKEYESIDDDIAALESNIERIDSEMAKCATDYGKLNDLSKEKAEKEKQLEEKMDRWVYLNDLAERIANQ